MQLMLYPPLPSDLASQQTLIETIAHCWEQVMIEFQGRIGEGKTLPADQVLAFTVFFACEKDLTDCVHLCLHIGCPSFDRGFMISSQSWCDRYAVNRDQVSYTILLDRYEVVGDVYDLTWLYRL